jgi:hypothetical protein
MHLDPGAETIMIDHDDSPAFAIISLSAAALVCGVFAWAGWVTRQAQPFFICMPLAVLFLAGTYDYLLRDPRLAPFRRWVLRWTVCKLRGHSYEFVYYWNECDDDQDGLCSRCWIPMCLCPPNGPHAKLFSNRAEMLREQKRLLTERDSKTD